MLLALENYEDAIETLDLVLTLAPKEPPVYSLLGKYAMYVHMYLLYLLLTSSSYFSMYKHAGMHSCLLIYTYTRKLTHTQLIFSRINSLFNIIDLKRKKKEKIVINTIKTIHSVKMIIMNIQNAD